MILPDRLSNLDTFVDTKFNIIRLWTMTDCGEPYTHPEWPGCMGITWGIELITRAGERVIFTWGENQALGDPFYLSIQANDPVEQSDSLRVLEVDAQSVLSPYLNSTLESYRILHREHMDTGRPVVYACHLIFEAGGLFVSTGQASDPTCVFADDICVIYEDNFTD